MSGTTKLQCKIWSVLVLAIVIGLLLSAVTRAQTVVDGDTIKLNGTTWRLRGIDAPEMHQSCGGWPAGVEATAYMRALLRDRRVTCIPEGHDRYSRTIGKCTADGIDIQAEMVRQGMAWAFRRYSLDYVPQENQAKAEGLGIHRYACMPAWEWRKDHQK
jgi:endonuclease YncB( thermonuclease family)